MILPELVPVGEFLPGRYGRIAEILHRLGMIPSPEIPEGFFHRQKTAYADLLTAEERTWLKNHPGIRFAFSDDYQPALIVHEDGRLAGILKDMLDLLNKRLGADFSIVADDLPTIRDMIENREVAGPLAMFPGAGNRYRLLPTSAMLTTFPVIYAGQDTTGAIHGVEGLVGRKCAIVGGMPKIESLVKPYDQLIAITDAERSSILKNDIVDIHANSKIGIAGSWAAFSPSAWYRPPCRPLERSRFPGVPGRSCC